jgi:hypothetical protein
MVETHRRAWKVGRRVATLVGFVGNLELLLVLL